MIDGFREVNGHPRLHQSRGHFGFGLFTEDVVFEECLKKESSWRLHVSGSRREGKALSADQTARAVKPSTPTEAHKVIED